MIGMHLGFWLHLGTASVVGESYLARGLGDVCGFHSFELEVGSQEDFVN